MEVIVIPVTLLKAAGAFLMNLKGPPPNLLFKTKLQSEKPKPALVLLINVQTKNFSGECCVFQLGHLRGTLH